MSNSVIMLEFNELSADLLDRFIAAGKLPGFKQLRNEAVVCVTDAGEDPPNLEPWIQWVSVHTGRTFAEHGVFDLSDGPKYKGARVWDVISEAGEPVWICGSMNASSRAPLNGYLVPDPWAHAIPAQPTGFFDPYVSLVSAYVQGYHGDAARLGPSAFAKFLAFMVANGISRRTIVDAFKQLAGEVTSETKWRRASILDQFQWDIFRTLYKKSKPVFSTFFLNSVAHYQHYYWRNMDPSAFSMQPTAEEQKTYQNAIEFGYQRMDKIVQEAIRMAGPDASIVLCTALSQQPLSKYDETGGKQVFKVADIASLTAMAGVARKYRYAPVMAEEFKLIFEDEAAAAQAEQSLATLELSDGRQAMRLRRDGAEIFAGCAIFQAPSQEVTVRSAAGGEPRRFSDVFFPIDGVKSGGHHREGVLWWRSPSRRHVVVADKIDLTRIAPTILAACDVKAPPEMGEAPIAEVLDAVFARSSIAA